MLVVSELIGDDLALAVGEVVDADPFIFTGESGERLCLLPY